MSNPILIEGNKYLPITLAGQQQKVEAAGDIYDDEVHLFNQLIDLEKERVGSCSPLNPGYERVLEFDASKIVISDLNGQTFKEKYAQYTDFYKKRFELYPFGKYGNAINTDLFKPIYNDNKKAFEFSVSSPRSGNPIFTNVINNPLYAGGSSGWDARDSKYIRFNTRFQAAFDMEITENFWTHFQHDVVAQTASRYLSFWQFKGAYSYNNRRVLGCSWDWSNTDEPCFMIIQQADSSLTDRPREQWDADNIVRRIPMNLGHKLRFELEIIFDPTGANSYTKVSIDGNVVLENDITNCFPTTETWLDTFGDFKPAIRGMYFGGYFGARPFITLPEPINIYHSNKSQDVWVGI